MAKQATLTIEVYEQGVSGQAPYLVSHSRKDGGTPMVRPIESDKAVIAWLRGALRRAKLEAITEASWRRGG